MEGAPGGGSAEGNRWSQYFQGIHGSIVASRPAGPTYTDVYRGQANSPPDIRGEDATPINIAKPPLLPKQRSCSPNNLFTPFMTAVSAQTSGTGP